MSKQDFLHVQGWSSLANCGITRQQETGVLYTMYMYLSLYFYLVICYIFHSATAMWSVIMLAFQSYTCIKLKGNYNWFLLSVPFQGKNINLINFYSNLLVIFLATVPTSKSLQHRKGQYDNICTVHTNLEFILVADDTFPVLGIWYF